jgi:DNA polymerase (family X)
MPPEPRGGSLGLRPKPPRAGRSRRSALQAHPGPEYVVGSESNRDLARRLEEAAALLEQQEADGFRARAYRRAAGTVASYPEDLRALAARDGEAALLAIPGVGKGIAAALAEMLATGRWSQLERLRGTLDPQSLFATVPGVGAQLARQMHAALAVDTLEALEAAAYDGRLAGVAGIGPRRLAAIRAGLAARLGRLRRAVPEPDAIRPAVALLLEVDRGYRAAAAAGTLPTIAPRRFNPGGESWLAVQHLTQGDWHFTALYSNTARAHELGRTRDWVVLYYYDHDHLERQCTVVTEHAGTLAGLRVVRGREAECRQHYAARATTPEWRGTGGAAGRSR